MPVACAAGHAGLIEECRSHEEQERGKAMSLLSKRTLWGVVAAAGLVLTPLPATAAGEGPADPGAWDRGTASAAGEAGVLAAIPEAEQVLVTGGCQSFDVTNRHSETVEVLYGMFGQPTEDGFVDVLPGYTVRVYTTRALIDYIAYSFESGDDAGLGEDVVIDQSCTVPANERYVTRVYMDLFHRAPDAAGLQAWVTALNAGTPRVQVANAITYSNEYRTSLITEVYGWYLGREPEPAGLADWLAAMQSGVTISIMESGFIASDEYYAAAGSTSAGWVDALYMDVLNREAAQSEIDSWVSALAAGASRRQVSMGFLLSTERLNTVVAGYYWELLDRDVDAAGQASWVRILQAGGRDEAIVGGIIASDEYYFGD